MGRALIASDAMAGLAEFRNAPVVTHQERAACFPVIGVLLAGSNVPFVQAFVVMQKDGWNVDTVRAGHAILAIVARDGIELHHQSGCFLEEGELFIRQGLER